MFVSGFTFIKNAIKLDYPVAQAILSILPLVDEMIVAVGNCEDDTRALILTLGNKIKIVDTIWDESLRKGGEVLAVETNKAFDAVSVKADWCFYIQADECVHEKYHSAIIKAMELHKSDPEVDGLLFDYVHFYGSYDYVGDSRGWYRNEIRIVKNNKAIRSWKDAQGFRIEDRKLKVKESNAAVYHYGWVRHPKYQMAKQIAANKLWHDDAFVQKNYNADTDFDYSIIDSIKPFTGTHPVVMQERIANMNWKFERDPKVKRFGLKKRFLYFIENRFGWRIGEYKNYILLK